ncbi:MAG: lyase, partial [Candidatus Marinimicrobia bacterium]|nr:lyase [Candidatus Neomarinimicrobiota bacterium]
MCSACERFFLIVVILFALLNGAQGQNSKLKIKEYKVPKGSHPHDVAPAPDGTVWYTAQHQEALGILDPKTGKTKHVHLGDGSSPHGVIVGPDGNAWITDSGLNAMVRVNALTMEVTVYPLPKWTGYANLNTATFDGKGTLWFTGQSGFYGRLLPDDKVEVFRSPKGRGPYGIATAPNGDVYYASLAGSYVGKVNLESGGVEVLEPPTRGQGARRVWADSKGQIWVAEWKGERLARYIPESGEWKEWKLPGRNPKPYAVYVDENDVVWL